MGVHNYGKPPSVVDRQQPASQTPFHQEPADPTLLQTLGSRRFWRQAMIAGIEGAVSASVIYFAMRYIERK